MQKSHPATKLSQPFHNPSTNTPWYLPIPSGERRNWMDASEAEKSGSSGVEYLSSIHCSSGTIFFVGSCSCSFFLGHFNENDFCWVRLKFITETPDMDGLSSKIVCPNSSTPNGFTLSLQSIIIHADFPCYIQSISKSNQCYIKVQQLIFHIAKSPECSLGVKRLNHGCLTAISKHIKAYQSISKYIKVHQSVKNPSFFGASKIHGEKTTMAFLVASVPAARAVELATLGMRPPLGTP